MPKRPRPASPVPAPVPSSSPAPAGPPPVPGPDQPSGCLPALLRVTWLLFGNAVLLILAGQVSKHREAGLADVLFFAALAMMLGVRYLDVTVFHGRTSDGRQATLRDWARWAAGMAVVGSGLWALARAAGTNGWI